MPRKLSHYTLGAQLGAGGMGEVYRATDESLGREVAIKLLPGDFARDEGRLARFRREATLLASLNHTNIATLYGLEEDDGTHFLVMELVEGEDLSTLIARGPLDRDDVFKIAYQIAVSLDAAHQKGVVHRDLKPGNIRITPTGHVKILDFGLAKAYEGDASPSDLSQSPTIMSGLRTVDGVILGTAAYMSPEQARGRSVDRRADVWAFGCVVYEMLTGRQAFSGETVTDVLARILEREPDWTALPDTAPPSLVQLLHDCLQKDPAERWRDMGDAALVLKRASVETPAGPGSGDAAGASRRTPLTARLWAAGTVALAIAAIALAFSQRGRSAGSETDGAAPPVMHFSQLTLQSGGEQDSQIGRDGRFIVYDAQVDGEPDIFLQRIGGRNAINLTRTPDTGEWTPAISPDGERIAFVSDRQDGGIFVMGATGESVLKVSAEGSRPAWSPDGKQLAYTMEDFQTPYGRSLRSALYIIDLDSREKRMVTQGDAVQPAWSPSGERIAFWSVNDSTGGQRDIQTIRTDGTGITWVTHDRAVDWSPVWAPDGRFIYFLSDRGGSMNLWRIPVDESTGEATGPPQPMTAPAENTRDLSVSGDGKRIVYSNVMLRAHLNRVDLDPGSGTGGALVAVTRGTLRVSNPRCSPDGEWVAFQGGNTQEDIYLVRADGSEYRQITNDAFRDRGPSFSPDGNRVVFYSDRGGRYELWSIRTDGSDLRQMTRTQTRSLWFPVYAPDGKHVAAQNDRGTFIVPIGDEPTPESEFETLPEPEPDVRFHCDTWSPDGRLISGRATTASYEDLPGLYVYDLDNNTYTRHAASKGNLNGSAWLPDARRLVSFSDEELLMIDTGSGEVNVLASGFVSWMGGISVSRDGTRVFFATTSYEADIWMASWE